MSYFTSYTLCYVPERTYPLKQFSIADCAIVAKTVFFMTKHCDGTTITRKQGTWYSHCDVIFVRKLAQRRSLLYAYEIRASYLFFSFTGWAYMWHVISLFRCLANPSRNQYQWMHVIALLRLHSKRCIVIFSWLYFKWFGEDWIRHCMYFCILNTMRVTETKINYTHK